MPGGQHNAEWYHKFISVEVLVAILMSAVGAIASWTLLTQKVEANQTKAETAVTNQTAIKQDVASIKTDIAVIKNDYQHLSETVKAQTEELKENNELLKTFLMRAATHGGSGQ